MKTKHLKVMTANMKIMQGRGTLFDEVRLVKTLGEDGKFVHSGAYNEWLGMLFSFERDINAAGHFRCHVTDTAEYDLYPSEDKNEFVVWRGGAPSLSSVAPKGGK
jgi:hypothetical protein